MITKRVRLIALAVALVGGSLSATIVPTALHQHVQPAAACNPRIGC